MADGTIFTQAVAANGGQTFTASAPNTGPTTYSPTYDQNRNITGYNDSSKSGASAKTEPTVLGSTNIDTKNQENTQAASNLSTPSQSVGATGFIHNSDQSFAEAPSDAVQVQDANGNTVWQSGGMTYALGPSNGKVSGDPAQQAIYDQFTSLKASMDATGAAQIENIKAQYEQLIKQQGQANHGNEASTYSLLARGGSLQTESSGGIIQAQISDGLTKIADLQNKENSAVIAATQAMQDGDYKILDKQLSIVQQARSERQAAAQKIQDSIETEKKRVQTQNDAIDTQIRSAMAEAQKGNATPEQMKGMQDALAKHDYAAALAAGGTSFQDPTSTAGQYAAYVKDANAKGLTPATPGDWMLSQKTKEAYATEAAKNQSDAAYTASDKTQQKLEQQYRGVLSKEFSARTGALGIENAKVNQANHLNSLFQQYYDPKTGNYNIPTAQYAELAIGLASMLAPTGQSSDADRAEIKSKTAAGDIKGALQYITGVPQNGNTQEIIKNLVDSVDRQAETAVRNREAALEDMRAQAPTDLEPSRIDALNKSTQMVSYEGESRLAKKTVDTYVKANPDQAETVAKLYEVPGATDKDIVDYLKAQGIPLQ